MSSALQLMCDALLAAVRPVNQAARDLHSVGSRLQATARQLNALGQSTGDRDLRQAAAQLQATEVAMKRAAQIAQGATQHAQMYVMAMVGTGQAQRPIAGAGGQVVAPVTAGVSPDLRQRRVREVWQALAKSVATEIAWVAGLQLFGNLINVEFLPDEHIRQAVEDLPITAVEISEVVKKWRAR